MRRRRQTAPHLLGLQMRYRPTSKIPVTGARIDSFSLDTPPVLVIERPKATFLHAREKRIKSRYEDSFGRGPRRVRGKGAPEGDAGGPRDRVRGLWHRFDRVRRLSRLRKKSRR